MSDHEPANGAQRRLIVNADDFGQSEGANEGITQAHEKGIVTSASLMVRWAAAEAASDYGRRRPELHLGLHLDFGEWTCADGCWTELYSVVPMNDAAAVHAEALRQLERFRELVGRDPSHIDSHQHAHLAEPLRSTAAEIGSHLQIPVRHMHPGIRYEGGFYGQDESGSSFPRGISPDNLIEILSALPPGVTELACHPAARADIQTMYREERLIELATLCDPRVSAAVMEFGIDLCGFGDIGAPVGQDGRSATTDPTWAV